MPHVKTPNLVASGCDRPCGFSGISRGERSHLSGQAERPAREPSAAMIDPVGQAGALARSVADPVFLIDHQRIEIREQPALGLGQMEIDGCSLATVG